MLRASAKTGLVFFPAFDWAISPTHPEREERLLYNPRPGFRGRYPGTSKTSSSTNPIWPPSRT